MNDAQQKLLTEAKMVMLRRLPYFGMFIIGMDMNEDKSIPTACTDGTQIKFNPDWLMGGGEDKRPLRTRDNVTGVLCHEVLHVSFKHMLRLGYRDPALANVAMDYAINLVLFDPEHPDENVGSMPDVDASKGEVKLLDTKYRGMTWETIYDMLDKERQKQGGGQKFKSGGVIIDLSKQDPGGMGGVERPVNVDGSGLSDAQRAALERDIDGRTSSSAAAAKAQGKLPAGLERFLTTAMAPIIDWRERLRQFVSKQFPAEQSWARPNRRHLWNDIYLPYTEKSGIGKILVVMDTSGSVDYSGDKSEGAQYWAEIKAIAEDCVPEELHCMYCDARVAGHDVFQAGDDPVLKPRGGGGTDFRPPFELVDKEGLQIQCAIYLTDGYGPFPEKPMPYPVFWCITTDVVPPWGDHVRLTK